MTRSVELDRFSVLVEKIYEGCTDPTAWPDILTSVAEHLGAEKGLLLTPLVRPGEGGFATERQGSSSLNLAEPGDGYIAEFCTPP